MYLDTAYIAKYYLPENDSEQVRKLIADSDVLISSSIAIAEMACVLHRQMREGNMTGVEVRRVFDMFLVHVEDGVWKLIPISDGILTQAGLLTGTAPKTTFLRAGDAVHLITAKNAGEDTIWTNDRHLLAAAPHFGLNGRSV